MRFKYNHEKNALLLSQRSVGFDEIIQAIADGNFLDIRYHYDHKKHPEQKILYVRLLKEVYAVPFVEEKNGDCFLKTLFPSRKARKDFLNE